MADMPEVPLTMEGSYVLHQMFRFARPEWRQQEVFHCDRIVQRAAETLGAMETGTKGGHPKPTAHLFHARPQGRFDVRPFPRFAGRSCTAPNLPLSKWS